MKVFLTHRMLWCFILTGFWQTVSGYVSPPNLASPFAGATINTFEAYLSIYSVSGAKGYQIQYDVVNTFNSSSLKQDTTSPNTSGIFTGPLLKGQKYYWRARAYKPGDTSDWSQVRDFTVFTKMELSSPANNTTGIIRPLQAIYVNYKTNPIYIFEADTNSSFDSPLKVLRSQDSPLFVDSAMFRFGGTVYWRATVIDEGGDTLLWSDIRKYTFYTQPTIDALSSTTGPQFIISWPNTALAEVVLQVDTNNSFDSPVLIEKLLPSYTLRDTLNDLLFGKKYYYRIRAKFDTSYSIWSLTKSVTVLTNGAINSPSNIGVVGILNITFGWTKLNGSNVQFQLSKSSDYSQIMKDTLNLSGTSYSYPPTLDLNTRYYFRIRYMHAKDTTEWFNRTFMTYTGQVNVGSPTDWNMAEEVRPRFRFREVPWATSYVLEIDTGTVFPSTPSSFYIRIDSFVFDGSYYSYADTSLLYNQNYVWRMYAIKDTEAAEPTLDRRFKTQAAPVGYFPQNNYIGIGTNTNALVTGIPGSTYIQWELDTTLSFNSVLYNSGVNPHVPDDFTPQYVELDFPKDLSFNAIYYWRSRCINLVDTGEWSSVFNFTTTTNVFMYSPADGSTNQPLSTILKWGIQGSAADYKYQYQLATDSDFTNKPIITLPVNKNGEITVTCAYGTQYYWRARVMHSKDTSDWSVMYRFKTVNAPVIAKPNLLTPPANATNVPITVVSFGWSIVANATDYDIEVASDADFTQVLASANALGTGAQMSNLMPGKRYYWRVRARMSSIIGAWSTVRWFETEAPVGLNETGVSSPILIYPNPANDEVSIDAQKPIAIAIYDLQGKCVFQSDQSQPAQKINTGNWTRGLYLVKIYSEGQVLTQKLVIAE